MQLRHARGTLDLSHPVVMGVLNVTPDSFSDGGRYLDPQHALDRAQQMLAEGATIIDVGGESTRPGAAQVSVAEELSRVLPVVRQIARHGDAIISVDTSQPEVMRAVVDAGAAMINDVRALNLPGALQVAAASSAAVCVMHMQGEPDTMQKQPHYTDVVSEVRAMLADRVDQCVNAGIDPARICVDPGFGFGKLLEHNLELLRRLPALRIADHPVLVGLSRKSMLRQLTGREADARLAGSVSLATIAVLQGASIVRTHDVAATVDALQVAMAVKSLEHR